MSELEQLLELSPPVVLALALNCIGWGLKKSPLAGWLLPLALMALGGAAYPFVAEVGKVSFAVRNPAAFNVVIGIAIGGLSVGLNQAFRQVFGRFFAEEEKQA